MKLVEIANSVDPDEVAQNEPPHLVYIVCPLSLNSQYELARTNLFFFVFFFQFGYVQYGV